ncbi:hypothetical protein Ciccas_009239, partial [Cichlidogyrus casuarinus]
MSESPSFLRPARKLESGSQSGAVKLQRRISFDLSNNPKNVNSKGASFNRPERKVINTSLQSLDHKSSKPATNTISNQREVTKLLHDPQSLHGGSVSRATAISYNLNISCQKPESPQVTRTPLHEVEKKPCTVSSTSVKTENHSSPSHRLSNTSARNAFQRRSRSLDNTGPQRMFRFGPEVPLVHIKESLTDSSSLIRSRYLQDSLEAIQARQKPRIECREGQACRDLLSKCVRANSQIKTVSLQPKQVNNQSLSQPLQKPRISPVKMAQIVHKVIMAGTGGVGKSAITLQFMYEE